MVVYLASGSRIKPVNARVMTSTHVWVDVPVWDLSADHRVMTTGMTVEQRPLRGADFGYFTTEEEARQFLLNKWDGLLSFARATRKFTNPTLARARVAATTE